MSDELLPYYERELKFIRTLGAEFAERNEKIAGRLRLGPDGSQDPHVERIIQAFAYLNARLRRKLDDDFPEIGQSLLDVVYPHYLRPIPSLAIAQFQLDRSQSELLKGHLVPRGTPMETESESESGVRCRFQTCYDVTAWPFQVSAVTVARRPFAAPTTRHSSRAQSVLRLQLDMYSPKVAFRQLQLGSLRFYLHAGQATNVLRLYELLFTRTLEVAIAGSPQDPDPVVLPAARITPVGFSREEGVLPYPARSFLGYRLLTEYFAFPRKFLFFELTGLSPELLARVGNHLEIFFYFNHLDEDLERDVNKDTFQLGCTPIINLFEKTAEPFELTHTQSEYLVVPDARSSAAYEIYSIDEVAATSPEGQTVMYQPFFSFKHAVDAKRQKTFWHATARPGQQKGPHGQRDEGRDLYLSFVDLGMRPSVAEHWTVSVRTTCLNRNLPERLPSGPGRPLLDLPEGKGVIGSVRCLTRPTSTLRPDLRKRVVWKIISQLSLNHLSLEDDREGVAALREILALYDLRRSAETRDALEGILSTRSRRIVGRIGARLPGFGQGVEVELELDEKKFASGGAYLFACVLDRFFGMYTSVNSFSKLIVKIRQRIGQEEPWQWPKRTGERELL